jgi:hypothetical protein
MRLERTQRGVAGNYRNNIARHGGKESVNHAAYTSGVVPMVRRKAAVQSATAKQGNGKWISQFPKVFAGSC